MIIELGIVAGHIWRFLEERDETTLSSLTSEVDKPRDTILMSLGWLARESHVLLEKQDEDYKITLRK